MLDGRNRLDALEIATGKEAVVGPPSITAGEFFACDKVIELDGRKVDPWAYVDSVNYHRRHLTAEQKRERIAKLLKAKPEASDRQIGKQIKADNKTVAAVRSDLERREEIPHVETRTDKRGRQQPATKVRAKKAGEKAPAPARHKITRAEEAKRLDAESEALVAKLVVQLDDETARELHRQLYTTDHRVVWRLTEMLGRKLKAEGFDADEDNDVDPETSAEVMKAAFSQTDSAYLDPGPIPEPLQRKPEATGTTSDPPGGVTLGKAMVDARSILAGLECDWSRGRRRGAGWP